MGYRSVRGTVLIAPRTAYLRRMFKAFEFCLPTNATKVPASPKFLALVILASAVAVSSTSAFAQPHKRTHYRSSNSMNVIRGRSNGSPRRSRAQVSAYPKNPGGAADSRC
jgi:hypothetical protein